MTARILQNPWRLLLAINAAVFQTKVLNEVNAADPSDIQSGSKRVRGFELSVVGNITDAWSISAGYAHQKTKVTNGSGIAADGSDGLTYSPDDSFSSWTSYRARWRPAWGVAW